MKKLSKMTLEEKIGQLIVIGGAVGGLGDETGIEDALRMIREKKVGGFYLGYPRYKNPLEAWQLNTRLRAAASDIPLFLCADMETSLGYIIIDGAERAPYLMGLGAARDETLARDIGAITGREARALGFNWNYGPSVDVNSNKDNPAIGIRAFGGDPVLVARMGCAYIKGCQSEGVLCSAKHFPGHGALAFDTHDSIGVADAGRGELMKRDIPPFHAAIRAGVKTVMSTHVIYPALGDSKFPATLSESIMTKLLREELGFTGLTTTDALSMKAISDNYGEREAVILSFLAGCDTLIVPASWRPYETLLEAAVSGRIPPARINEAVERILQAKAWLYPDGCKEPKKENVTKVFESAATKETLEKLSLKSVTVLEKKALPLKAGARKRLFVIQERDEAYQYCPWEKGVLDKAERMILEREPGAVIKRVSMACSAEESKDVLKAAGECEEVVFFCIVKVLIEQYNGRLSSATNELLSKIASERSLVVLSLGSPYVIDDIANCAGFICTYGESDICARTALAVLYGEAAPGGKLPVNISEKYPFGLGLSL